MKVVSDLHFHSRFSRAVSPKMTIPNISLWAKKKGILLASTTDFTHPVWYRELLASLEESGEGIYKLKGSQDETRFLLTTEISCVYTKGGRGRRVHLLVFAPSLKTVEKLNQKLTSQGANLLSDGRPMTGLSAKNILEIALEVDERCLVIPAHIWTPHYSVFGSNSGFDSLEECFEELTTHIKGIETGLSSDPTMNWKVQELKNRSILSFSDAHSPAKMGREATVFDIPEISYECIRKAISREDEKNCKISHTIEFYPEEGKYHYTGHRKCQVVFSPNDARKKGTVCPVCGKHLTVGVSSRVESLGREEVETETYKDDKGVLWIKNKNVQRPPYVMIVPLVEIISESIGIGPTSQRVLNVYEQLIFSLKNEFNVLLKADLGKIQKIAGERVALGVKKVRSGDIYIKPGYDGLFGVVKIWKEEEEKTIQEGEETSGQETLF